MAPASRQSFHCSTYTPTYKVIPVGVLKRTGKETDLPHLAAKVGAGNINNMGRKRASAYFLPLRQSLLRGGGGG